MSAHRETASAGAPGTIALDGGTLEQRILDSLDGLVRALDLEPLGGDLFRALSEPGRFGHVFGGQVIGQALVAAGATVVGKDPQSLHAYFVEAGATDEPVELAVERVRDGRSMSTRHVTVHQAGRPLLTAIASFHTNPTSPELRQHVPAVPAPEQLPVLQDWVRDLPPERYAAARNWVEQPPPLDLRIGEPPSFLDGHTGTGARSHWTRLPREVGDDPLLHAALVAYASDYLLVDMVLRAHPQRAELTAFRGASLDHSIWFHRPPRFDGWHLHTQDALAVSGHRGLARGTIHDDDGHLLASVMQEVLVRPA